jgi:hypothetical protein
MYMSLMIIISVKLIIKLIRYIIILPDEQVRLL